MNSGLRTDDLEYPFDPACIATEPVEPRDAAKMMVYDRATDRVHHTRVAELPQWLRRDDTLLVNRTKVSPARLLMRREADGRSFEGLLATNTGDGVWLLLVKGARRLRQGDRLQLIDEKGRGGAWLLCKCKTAEGWLVKFDEGVLVQAALDHAGRTPLPPYIVKARHTHTHPDQFDRVRYQTVYADDHHMHSVAAPTAGLHLTQGLLERIHQMGVRRQNITLEVGLGTFQPIECEWLAHHAMHSERYEIEAEALDALRLFRSTGTGRIVVVGTTTVRAVESLPEPLPLDAYAGVATMLIQPGHSFRHVSALLTNFHLPRSTLIALVAAFVGLDRLKQLYAIAQQQGYRFYSYGDCMLVV